MDAETYSKLRQSVGTPPPADAEQEAEPQGKRKKK